VASLLAFLAALEFAYLVPPIFVVTAAAENHNIIKMFI
jgi:hypothetical protein